MSWRLLSLSGSGEILTSGFKCGVCFFSVQLVDLPGALEKNLSGNWWQSEPRSSGLWVLDTRPPRIWNVPRVG